MARFVSKLVLSLVVALGALTGACAVTGCEAGASACEEGFARVVIKGERFCLEEALDSAKRVPGLGGRESIPENGGMLFVFPRPLVLEFVMRDCLVDIDIAYLDGTGRVVSMHEMKVEPRREGETDWDYEQRLTRYSSRYSVVFAVEVRAGKLAELGLEVGDIVELDAEGLKARAR